MDSRSRRLVCDSDLSRCSRFACHFIICCILNFAYKQNYLLHSVAKRSLNGLQLGPMLIKQVITLRPCKHCIRFTIQDGQRAHCASKLTENSTLDSSHRNTTAKPRNWEFLTFPWYMFFGMCLVCLLLCFSVAFCFSLVFWVSSKSCRSQCMALIFLNLG